MDIKEFSKELEKRTRETIDQAVRLAESDDPPERSEIFLSVFESCTPRLTRELEEKPDADA